MADQTPEELDVVLERINAEALAEMSPEDLGTLRADLESRKANVELAIGDLPPTAEWTDETIATAVGIKDAIARIDGALATVAADETRRAEEATAREAQAQALLAELTGTAAGPEDDEPDAEGGEGDGKPEDDESDIPGESVPDNTENVETDIPAIEAEVEVEEPVKVAASAKPVARRVEARGNPTAPRTAPAKRDERMVLRASANAAAFGPGTILDSPDKIARVFQEAIRASANYEGPAQDIILGSYGAWDAAEIYGEERTLRDNARDNQRKLEKLMASVGLDYEGHVVDQQKLAASGGPCAPAQVRYDQPVIGTNARPVRDGLVLVGADRMGIRTIPPPQMTDVTGGSTTWTKANDTTPSSPTTKNCLTMTCADEDETWVDAIVQCLKVGNYRQRNFPEQIQAWLAKAAQYAARVAETKMLTSIGTGSTQVTVAATGNELGTARNILTTLDRATSRMRSRYRLDPNYPFTFMAPFWLKDNMITDLTREVPGATAERLATSEAEINRFLAAKMVNVTWFLDGESGQVYGAQSDGALLGWASHVISYLFPTGQWLALDGGSLDFGITRDATLNATNDFVIMSEFFENVHQVYLADSLRLDIDICPNGKTSLPVAIDPCTAGS